MCGISLSSSDWIALGSLAVAGAAFVVAWVTLREAEDDWRQMKWFDLYFRADEGYNALEKYQTVHAGLLKVQTAQQATDWNDLMFQIRLIHTTALVFPQNADVDNLIASTSAFQNPANAFDPHRLPQMMKAIQGLRDRAKLKQKVLKQPKYMK
jgi:hypothetical protein